MKTGDADFAPLGEMELTGTGELFKQCEFIRDRAANAGLIVVQWANDVEWALTTIPVLTPGGWHGIGADNPQRRARRVAAHAYRAAEALRAAGMSAAKLPPAYLATYQDIIQHRRQRPKFDPRAGL